MFFVKIGKLHNINAGVEVQFKFGVRFDFYKFIVFFKTEVQLAYRLLSLLFDIICLTTEILN